MTPRNALNNGAKLTQTEGLALLATMAAKCDHAAQLLPHDESRQAAAANADTLRWAIHQIQGKP
jgi:hypothetical protein